MKDHRIQLLIRAPKLERLLAWYLIPWRRVKHMESLVSACEQEVADYLDDVKRERARCDDMYRRLMEEQRRGDGLQMQCRKLKEKLIKRNERKPELP